MDEDLLARIKNTLLVILKTREEVTAVAVLAGATGWEVNSVVGDHYDREELWGARIFLPAQTHFRQWALQTHVILSGCSAGTGLWHYRASSPTGICRGSAPSGVTTDGGRTPAAEKASNALRRNSVRNR